MSSSVVHLLSYLCFRDDRFRVRTDQQMYGRNLSLIFIYAENLCIVFVMDFFFYWINYSCIITSLISKHYRYIRVLKYWVCLDKRITNITYVLFYFPSFIIIIIVIRLCTKHQTYIFIYIIYTSILVQLKDSATESSS